MILMVLILILIAGLFIRSLPVFAVGILGLFLYVYPGQTILAITAIFTLYYYIRGTKYDLFKRFL